jgi:hypothetical protein
MTVDTELGFLGVIVGFLGIGATYLWPSKKWIGKSALTMGAVVFVWAVIATVTSRSTSAEAVANQVFSGLVSDQTNHKPISDADILVAQDQSLPEVVHSDGHGVFAFRLHQGVVSLRINVSANGYIPEVRMTSPIRTGPEEFELKPNSSITTVRHPSIPTTNGKSNLNSHQGAPTDNSNGKLPQSGQTVICDATHAPCGINNGTTNYFVLGTPPPAVRSVSPEKVTDAIATLRVATAGTTLRIDGVGQSSDLDSFTGQIQQLFQLGGWQTFRGSRTLDYTSTEFTGSGVSTSHGEGVRCFSQNPSTAFIAKRALEQIGYPCQGDYTPDYLQRFPADFYVSIGAPTN